MFDSITHTTETRVTPITQVVEKSITPDKVVEMYDKVKEEVEKKMLRSFVIEGNQMNGVVIEIENDYGQDIHKVLSRFNLNGVEYLRTFILKREEILYDHNAYQFFKDHFIDVVSNELLKIAAPNIITLNY